MKLPKILTGLRYFNLATLSLILNPKSLRYYLGQCRIAYFRRKCNHIPITDFYELFPECRTTNETISLLIEPRTGGLTALELSYLATLVKCRPIRRIFEFGTFVGTFDGCSAIHLMLNLKDPHDTTLYTLDLPPQPKEKEYTQNHNDMEFHQLRRPGYYINKYDSKGIVQQLSGDSLTYDLSAYQNSMDLVFIDGSHELSHVIQDTKNALNMIRPGGSLSGTTSIISPENRLATILNN